jgi:hypothetical protein
MEYARVCTHYPINPDTNNLLLDDEANANDTGKEARVI